VMLSDFADRPPRTVADDEILAIGRRRLRFLSTPHLPHGWDAGLWFDQTDRTLFCSDLFFQPGDPAAMEDSDILAPAEAAIRTGQAGPLANDVPYTRHTDAHLARLAELEPATLAVMHGSSFRGDCRGAIDGLRSVLRQVLG
ncbi:MAG TPA: hypothetical protein VEB21_05870, partial [Terriglobales bacterium]|nr:hypothetical protein [Terriglobales bacterium]